MIRHRPHLSPRSAVGLVQSATIRHFASSPRSQSRSTLGFVLGHTGRNPLLASPFLLCQPQPSTGLVISRAGHDLPLQPLASNATGPTMRPMVDHDWRRPQRSAIWPHRGQARRDPPLASSLTMSATIRRWPRPWSCRPQPAVGLALVAVPATTLRWPHRSSFAVPGHDPP
jgi:hypothetical protein